MLCVCRRAKNPAHTSYILKLLFCTLKKGRGNSLPWLQIFQNLISNIWTLLLFVLTTTLLLNTTTKNQKLRSIDLGKKTISNLKNSQSSFRQRQSTNTIPLQKHKTYCNKCLSLSNLKLPSLKNIVQGLPWWHSGWESACQCRGHVFEPWSEKTLHAAEQLSLCATTTQSVLYSPWATTTEAHMPRARAPQQEKPSQWEARAPQWRVASTHHN